MHERENEIEEFEEDEGEVCPYGYEVDPDPLVMKDLCFWCSEKYKCPYSPYRKER